MQRENTKRICIISGLFGTIGVGGAELQLYYLASEFARMGHQTHVITSAESDIDLTDMENKGIHLHLLSAKPLHTSKFKLDFYWKAWKELLQIIPDICLVRTAPLAPLALAYAKLKGKKFIYSVTADKDCTRRRLSGVRSLPKVLVRSFSQFAIKHADKVVAQSDFQKEKLKINLGIQSDIIKNGHPLPETVSQKSVPPVILWLGNLRNEKRIDLFVQLAQRFKDEACQFVVAGKSLDKGCLEELEEGIRGQNNLKYFGALSAEEAANLAGKASVLVNTSDNEGFPNAFVEAWMRGTPTISLNVDPDGLIKKNKMGFHSGSFELMVKDLRMLCSDGKLLSQLGLNARTYAVKSHDIKKIAALYESIFLKSSKRGKTES